MKNKRLFFNFIIFLLLLSSIALDVKAIKYSIGVYEDQELIWKCNVSNLIEMDSIFGTDWNDSGIFKNLSIGKRMKWKINTVEVNETHLKLNFSIWEWTSESTWGVKYNDSEMIYYSNPLNYSQDWNFSHYSSLVPFLFPIPVGEYLGGLRLNDWYDVDNRVLPTLNVEIGRNESGFPSKDIKIIAIYNDQGILNSYKLYIRENVVILDISLDFLPFYVIPTLIGLTIIFPLTFTVYILRKRKTRIHS